MRPHLRQPTLQQPRQVFGLGVAVERPKRWAIAVTSTTGNLPFAGGQKAAANRHQRRLVKGTPEAATN